MQPNKLPSPIRHFLLLLVFTLYRSRAAKAERSPPGLTRTADDRIQNGETFVRSESQAHVRPRNYSRNLQTCTENGESCFGNTSVISCFCDRLGECSVTSTEYCISNAICQGGECACAGACLNGGRFTATASTFGCECSDCNFPWQGRLCDVCPLQNCGGDGALLNTQLCQCYCEGQCLHGGKFPEREELDSFSDLQDTVVDCNCEECDVPWEGRLCDVCPLTGCVNDGIFNADLCRCNNCPTVCNQHGTLQPDCSCECDSPRWTGTLCNECNANMFSCKNGGVKNNSTCRCDCDDSVICRNGGTLSPDNCGCSCPSPWAGPTCEVCGRAPLTCQNGGIYDENTCQCNCPKTCLNGGTTTETCSCTCDNFWEGNLCEVCPLVENVSCLNAGALVSSTCDCECGAAVCENTNECQPTGSKCECECSNSGSAANRRQWHGGSVVVGLFWCAVSSR